MKTIKPFLIIFSFILLCSCLSTDKTSPVQNTPLAENGKLRVEGVQLVNAQGNPVLLKGISGHGLQWFPDCMKSREAFEFINGVMGANLFRIANIIPMEYYGYMKNPQHWIKKIKKIVDLCEELGIYVIIDWHVLFAGDPMTYVDQAKDFWQSIAAAFSGKKHVIYEICNEPNGEAVTWDRIKEYSHIIIPAIRAIDSETVILVGTPHYSGNLAGPAHDPLSYDNLMYTVHFYAASRYHHLSDRLEPYIDKIPIFVSEWGTSDHSGDYPLDLADSDVWLDFMEGDNPGGVKISWAIWSWGDKDEGSSILLPGTCPGPFSLDRLTETGLWLYNRLRKR